jgi:hypothetical protein
MRIALHAVGEAGRRAGRILLAERDLTALGLYRQEGGAEERRTIRVDSLEGFDVLVSDTPDPAPLAREAAAAGISAVFPAPFRVDRRLLSRFLDAGSTLLVGAGLSTGIAETLASHEMARTDAESEIAIAWTIPGRPLRRGAAVPFPDPVGARWASRVGRAPRRRPRGVTITRWAAPVRGTWAGALARVTGVRSGDRVERVVGVADQAAHLDAIALAAGAVVTAGSAFPPGLHRPPAAALAYLGAAMRIGLGVAAYEHPV